MAIPDYQTIMLPLLRLAGDGAEHRFREVVTQIADQFSVPEAEREELLPSGRGIVIRNRVGWARTYLLHSGLLEATRRGYFQITDRGKEILAGNPERIDIRFLERFPEFQQFRSRRGTRDRKPRPAKPPLDDTPEETLDAAYQQLREELETDLLAQVKAAPPEFFERLVVTLLLKMGYGGSREDAGKSVGRSGDGGIDGIIKEDRLGLDAIYIQAKRWDSNVGRPEIQKFAGALQGHRARKGVFLTTASFSREAEQFAEMIDSNIVLIDGEGLAALMVDHNVGVSTVDTYEIKKVDTDFFSEE